MQELEKHCSSNSYQAQEKIKQKGKKGGRWVRERRREIHTYKYILPCICVLRLCRVINCEGLFKKSSRPSNPASCRGCCVSLQNEIRRKKVRAGDDMLKLWDDWFSHHSHFWTSSPKKDKYGLNNMSRCAAVGNSISPSLSSWPPLAYSWFSASAAHTNSVWSTDVTFPVPWSMLWFSAACSFSLPLFLLMEHLLINIASFFDDPQKITACFVLSFFLFCNLNTLSGVYLLSKRHYTI